MSNLQSILAKSGIGAVPSNPSGFGVNPATGKKEKTLESRLENSGLALDVILAELSNIIQNPESEGLKLKAIEHALKMHGVMKDSGAAPASVTININDGAFGNGNSGVGNPILYPREISISLEETVSTF